MRPDTQNPHNRLRCPDLPLQPVPMSLRRCLRRLRRRIRRRCRLRLRLGRVEQLALYVYCGKCRSRAPREREAAAVHSQPSNLLGRTSPPRAILGRWIGSACRRRRSRRAGRAGWQTRRGTLRSSNRPRKLVSVPWARQTDPRSRREFQSTRLECGCKIP